MVGLPSGDRVLVRTVRLDGLTPTQESLLTAAATPSGAAGLSRVLDPGVARRRLLARGLLRVLLADGLGIPTERVELVRRPGGKPMLTTGAGSAASGLGFNVSHSRDVVVVAIARDRAVGVDVEAIDPSLDVDAIVRRFFAPAEARSLLALPSREKSAQFFREWCRKEALLKAVGTGLRRGLHEVLTPGVAFAHRPVPVPGTPGWWVMDLDVSPGFCCAVAAEGRDWVAEVLPWPEVSGAVRPALSWQVDSDVLVAPRRSGCSR